LLWSTLLNTCRRFPACPSASRLTQLLYVSADIRATKFTNRYVDLFFLANFAAFSFAAALMNAARVVPSA